MYKGKENFESKLSREIPFIDCDEEYYYVAGQCVAHMEYKCKKNYPIITHGNLVGAILRTKKYLTFKAQILNLFRKCSRALSFDDTAFRKSMAMLVGYTPDTENVLDSFIDGYGEKNIIKKIDG